MRKAFWYFVLFVGFVILFLGEMLMMAALWIAERVLIKAYIWLERKENALYQICFNWLEFCEKKALGGKR